MEECDTLSAEWEVCHSYHDTVKMDLSVGNNKYTVEVWKELTWI